MRQALGFTLPTMLLLIGNQGMYQKFFSARSENDAKLAVGGWIVGTLLLETSAGHDRGDGQFASSIPTIRARSSRHRATGAAALLGAILLGGDFRESHLDGEQLPVLAGHNIIHDVYERFIDREASERRKLMVSRLIVVVLGMFALVQAAYFESILRAALYAYTVYGAAVTPAVMAVFFWKRATTAGAISSIAPGTVMTVGWNVAGSSIRSMPSIPALGASVLSLIVVSLLTPPPAEEKWQPFFRAGEDYAFRSEDIRQRDCFAEAEGSDGWLFFDHHLRDPLAYRVLGLSARADTYAALVLPDSRARRTARAGAPHRARHAGWAARARRRRIPVGRSRWTGCGAVLEGCRRVAMQYSPHCAIPYVSMVDAGTVELVRGAGVEVVSSADLIQYFEARWTHAQAASAPRGRTPRGRGAAERVPRWSRDRTARRRGR